MARKHLVDYVHKTIEDGYSEEQIRTALSDQGWSSNEIEETFVKAKEVTDRKSAPPPPPKKSEWDLDLKSFSVSQLLLYLGALIVVLAGITYVGINWSQWGVTARILAILFPVLMFYGAGVALFFRQEYKKIGVVCLFLGAILFPLFLTIMFRELRIFVDPFSASFGLSVSSLSLLLCIASMFIFRFPLWAFLCQLAGVFVYYFFLRSIGVPDFFEATTMLWLFLIPANLYLFLALLFDKNNQKIEALYSQTLGALVLLGTFNFLFSNTNEAERFLYRVGFLTVWSRIFSPRPMA